MSYAKNNFFFSIMQVIFKKLFYWFFLRERKGGERGRERETMWERNTDQWPPATHNEGMCPDRELNPPPFGVQDSAPTNWATSPGHAAGLDVGK